MTFRCVKNITPQLIKSLKKALEPVLTDVRIDWFLPENLEAFLSPSEIPPLYPGDRLIGYCTLYDMTNFKAKKTEVCVSTSSNFPLACKQKKTNICISPSLKPEGQGYKGAHRDSTGSVFGQSNDELSPPPSSELMPAVSSTDGNDLEDALREISREISSEFSCAREADPAVSQGPSLIT